MKIQCDVCERAPATVICCADEAALCSKCDIQVHAANLLASKHQRLLLHSLSSKIPNCDICQERAAFIFCVEDRALFCKDCDGPIHSSGLAANHQRFLATGIRVAPPVTEPEKRTLEEPPSQSGHQISTAKPQQNQINSGCSSASWGVDELLNFSELESSNEKEQELGEFDWLNEIELLGELEDEGLAAEVPQVPTALIGNGAAFRATKGISPFKKARYEVSEEDDEFFTVPDLG